MPLAACRSLRPCSLAHAVCAGLPRGDRRNDGPPPAAERHVRIGDGRNAGVSRRDELRKIDRLRRPVHKRRVGAPRHIARERRRARMRAHRDRRTDVQRPEDGKSRTRGRVNVQDHVPCHAIGPQDEIRNGSARAILPKRHAVRDAERSRQVALGENRSERHGPAARDHETCAIRLALHLLVNPHPTSDTRDIRQVERRAPREIQVREVGNGHG